MKLCGTAYVKHFLCIITSVRPILYYHTCTLFENIVPMCVFSNGTEIQYVNVVGRYMEVWSICFRSI